MKTCPVCALDMEDTYLFCPDDGSSLRAVSSRSSENEPVSPSEVHHDTAGAVVLYCPACASEYPLTFSACPMHGVPLTEHNIPRFSNNERETAVELQSKQPEAILSNQLARLDLKPQRIERPRRMPEAATAPGATLEIAYPKHRDMDPSQKSDTDSGYSNSPTEFHEQASEQPGLRVAAIATVIALALFALVAIHAFVSNIKRRPSESPSESIVRVASATEEAPQSLPYVPTPREAQDYTEKQPASMASTPPEPRADRSVERKSNDSVSGSTTGRSLRGTTVANPGQKSPVTTPTQTPAAMTKVSTSPMPALPRGDSGGFDARLIRVRSRKTPSGFRYDLTFNMQEQSNRAAQWQRVLISTRSASGMSHSEAIPFVHRLGATGALTFTIGVELTGRSEDDWRGRVVCTTLGWDNKGAPLQASFGANLTP